MPEKFLLNTWYMAGWATHLESQGMLTQTIADMPIVIARSKQGELFALHDRCPHRFAPLSRGRVTAQGIECGYHGLTFDGAGQCVANPLGEAPPKAARVRSFPVHAQDEVIWVWLGDPEKADISAIPRLPCYGNPNLRFVFGITQVKGNYQLLTDNLLDLTHAVYLHPAFGNPTDRPIFTMEKTGNTIWAKYVVKDVPCPAFFAGVWSSDGKNVDLWDEIRWNAPSIHYLESGAMVTGQPRDQGIKTPAVHILTPVSSTRTTYFWSSAVPKDAAVTDEQFHHELRSVFENEDVPMVEATQQRMGDQDFWSMKPVLLKNDSAGVSARRVLLEMINNEQQQ